MAMTRHPYCVKSFECPQYSRRVVLVSAVNLWAVVPDAGAVTEAARQMLTGCGAGVRFGLHVMHARAEAGDPEAFGSGQPGLRRWYPPVPARAGERQ